MMSSTCTRIQSPVHTYGHRETEPQQSYPHHHFTSYSTDSRSLANANSYTHTEDLYNDPGCSYVPYGLEASQTDESFGYGQMQNNSNASPQPLCPRPTHPPSQFSPHFSWYDWPSEASAHIYEAEGSRHTSTSFLPYLPQGETEHSFGNQQYMSKPYPTPQESAEAVPISLAPNYPGDGYSQPFMASTSSFDQGPTRSTYIDIQTGFYFTGTAHQPVLPEQRSSYSELAPNLKFMNSQTPKPPHVHNKPSHTQEFSIRKPKNDDAMAKGTISTLDVEKNPFALGFDGPPLTAFGRKVPIKPCEPTRRLR